MSKEENTYYKDRPSFGRKGPSKLRQQFNRGMTYFLVDRCLYFGLFCNAACDSNFRYGIKDTVYPEAGAVWMRNCIFVESDCEVDRPSDDSVFGETLSQIKEEKQISRGVGIFVSVILMIALIVTLLNMMIPELYGSIRDMIFNVPSQMNRFIHEFSKMHSSDSTVGKMLESIVEEASDFVQNWMKTDLMEKVNLWMTQLTVGMIQMVREVFNFIIGIIVSIYVLFSKEKFQKQTKKLIYAVFRPGQANMILQIGGKSNEIFGGFIIGKIIDSLIIGVICFIGLSILNMPYTMLVSVIVGVTNVIPFFGPYIGAIPSAILILLADPLKGLYFIIFVIALQQFDGNVLGPKILGNSTGLSSFWVVFSILIAGGLFGIPGMLFGVPTFAVIYYIVNMLVNSILKKKELPTDTECYGKNGYVDSEGIYIQKEKQEEIKEIQEEKGDKDNADSSTK